MANEERITITIRTTEELDLLEPEGSKWTQGEKARDRLKNRIDLGLPINMSVSKRSLLGRMLQLREIISSKSSKEAEKEAGRSVH